MFDAMKEGFKRARKMFGPLFSASGEAAPNRHELRLESDEYAVKRKLGASFFTRRLTPNTRAARIASLTQSEYDIARSRGWIG